MLLWASCRSDGDRLPQRPRCVTTGSSFQYLRGTYGVAPQRVIPSRPSGQRRQQGSMFRGTIAPMSRDEVLAAAMARADALARQDARALRGHLHPLFTWTSHRGETFDRDAYVRRNTAGELRWHGQTFEDVEVAVIGDTAVLRCQVIDDVERPGHRQTFRMPMTQTWVRVGGAWTCLAGHAGPSQPARSRRAGGEA